MADLATREKQNGLPPDNAFLRRHSLPRSKRPPLKLGRHTLHPGRRTLVMGILNVTPDSFFDGGRFVLAEQALERAWQMIDSGADIIDIGGESSRPGSHAVSSEEEWRRIEPVVKGLAGSETVISVDTCKSGVARMALEAGADLINDISGGTIDPDIAGVVATFGAGLVIMHIQGTPKNMQENPSYENLMEEIHCFLEQHADEAIKEGVNPASIIIDPGIGFGKKLRHNLEIISRLSFFRDLPFPILVGASRKSFIGQLTGLPVEERLEGSLGAAAAAVQNGADMLRVHDVRETARMLAVVDALKPGEIREGD